MADIRDIAADIPLPARPRRLDASPWSRMRGFWRWWKAGLLAWLPTRLRTLLGVDSRRLLIRTQAAGVAFGLERNGDMQPLGELPTAAAGNVGDDDVLDGLLPPPIAELPRWALLPAEAVLRRRLLLPAAAADRLRDVLGYEIDRQTPFAADDVQFDAWIVGPRADGRIDVELVVVQSSALDAWLAGIAGVTRTLSGVDVEDGVGGGLGVNLLPVERRWRRIDRSGRWNLLLLAVGVLALAMAMWQWLDNRRAAADALEQATARQLDSARAASTRRRQLIDLVDGIAYLQALRAGRPTMIELWDEVTRRLPDTTHLERFEVTRERMLLAGLSDEASSLVGRLEGAPHWRSPALTGALLPDPANSLDRFNLVAELVQDAPPNIRQEAGSDAQSGR